MGLLCPLAMRTQFSSCILIYLILSLVSGPGRWIANSQSEDLPFSYQNRQVDKQMCGCVGKQVDAQMCENVSDWIVSREEPELEKFDQTINEFRTNEILENKTAAFLEKKTMAAS